MMPALLLQLLHALLGATVSQRQSQLLGVLIGLGPAGVCAPWHAYAHSHTRDTR